MGKSCSHDLNREFDIYIYLRFLFGSILFFKKKYYPSIFDLLKLNFLIYFDLYFMVYHDLMTQILN